MTAYTPQQLAEIEQAISKERLTRYLIATNNDFGLALSLYEQNVELSEGLFGFLHGLEVAVRNSIHDTLSAEVKAADWWNHGVLSLHATAQPKQPIHPVSFTHGMREMIGAAKSKAGSGATPGKVVAELNFGFWPTLISKRFDKFWIPCLHRAFPFANAPRRVIHGRLDTIRLLRNRIAHHERVLTTGNKLYTGHAAAPYLTLSDILECAKWVSPGVATWLETQFRYARAEAILVTASKSGISQL